MTKLVLLSGKELCKLLEFLGFRPVSQSGSHVRYVHPDGRRTVVPIHGNEDLDRSLIRQIIREIGLTPEDYERVRRLV